MPNRPSILFLSMHDAVRGPMAQALLRDIAGDRYRAMSAGVFPLSQIHPLTRRVLEEIGIDANGLVPRSVREYLARAKVSVAVILSDDDPGSPRMYPFARTTLRWSTDIPPVDGGVPEAELHARFRRIRDDLRSRILAWVGEFEGGQTPAVLTGIGDAAAV